jgi:hypothetical protein
MMQGTRLEGSGALPLSVLSAVSVSKGVVGEQQTPANLEMVRFISSPARRAREFHGRPNRPFLPHRAAQDP